MHILDYYIQAPFEGKFPQIINLNIVFEVEGQDAVYQVRLHQESQDSASYVNLMRWSNDSETWITVATRKPRADYNLQAVGCTYNENFYSTLEDDLYEVAETIEQGFRNSREAKRR